MSGWHIVRTYIARNWPVYLTGVSLTATGSLLAVMIPRLLGRFADRLQYGALTISDTAGIAGLIIVIGMVRVSMAWTGRMLVHGKGRILTYNLRRDLLRKWSTLSPAYYHRHSIGDLLSHALSDVDVVRELVSMGINVSATGLSMMVCVLYMMAVHGDWRLTLAALVPLCVIPVLVKCLGPQIKKQSQRTQEALGGMAQTVEEVIGGIRAVKAFGNERVVIGRFTQKVDAIVDEKMNFVRLSALFGALVPLMANLGFIVVLGYGGSLVITGAISLGDFVAFTMYVAMLKSPLEHLGQVLNVIQRASASLARLSALLQVVPTVRDREGILSERPLQGEVRVERLKFRYPGTERDVLSDVSFVVAPGKTLGIIGPMGSGKTTLADLLLRLYDPPAGTVYIDGEDILHYPLARLRQAMAYVPQDGFLFSTTVLENIGFSDNEPDREKAIQSARISAVYDNVMRFPEGFETEIGERGVRLSGGQKQRLAIARMLYKDAHIRILDDSLSAVDTRTERIILGNISIGTKDTATIIISHRLSAVQHADEILVLEGGRVVERGNHVDLVASAGPYAKLWNMQSGLTEEEASSRESGSKAAPDLMQPIFSEEMQSMESSLVEEAV
jgi:ATP-binding cassette subfamily B multidrug efflux pump